MRLWHKDLIPYLPKQQLLGQWRELNSIFKLQNRHILINFVYDYSEAHLFNYSLLVINEMKKRNYKIKYENFNNYFDYEDTNYISFDKIYFDKMNDEYLKICYYNLLEKYRCGGITQNEWNMIEERFGGMLCDK